MIELAVKDDDRQAASDTRNGEIKHTAKAAWETPKMEDVSGQVMAQPYIRFT